MFRANPGVTAGRILLGDAYRRKGRADDAVASYAMVPARPPGPRAQAIFNTAIVEAERCRASRVLSMNPVRSEPILMEARLGSADPSENLERK